MMMSTIFEPRAGHFAVHSSLFMFIVIDIAEVFLRSDSLRLMVRAKITAPFYRAYY